VARPVKFDDTYLLDRATELLWREGCDAVTIRDLEAALDLRAPSIYRRFHSRDELIARSVDRYVERVVCGRIRRLLDDGDDPVDGLRRFFTSVLTPMAGESRPRGCLLTVTAGQTAFADDRVRAAVTAGLDSVEQAFRRQLTRAQGSGQLSSDADVHAMATSLLLAFEGLLVLARSGHSGLHTSVDALFAAHFPTTPRSPERTTSHG